MRTAPQVLVVGGGPAGASTAWHLARAGVSVTLVDRARFPRDKPCAEYLSPECGRILDAMGALSAIEQAGAAQLTGMLVHSPAGAIIHGEFAAEHGFRGFRDRGLALRRITLDALLIERARAAGATVIEGAKVESLIEETGGICAGARIRTEEGVNDCRATFVVGADGLRSQVARRLGLTRVSRWPRRIALVAHYTGVGNIGPHGEMHVTRNGYVGLADVGHGVTNVALVVPMSQARAVLGHGGRPEAFLDEWLNRHDPLALRFAAAMRTDGVRVTGPFASQSRRAWAPGALLVGDAADFFDPFTGEGIYAALRGGELVAPFVIEVLAARNARDRVRPLMAYESARRSVFSGKWRVERLVGMAVAVPALINHAARVLEGDRALADLLIGVTGDFVPARELLRWRVLRRLLLPPFGRGPRPHEAVRSTGPAS